MSRMWLICLIIGVIAGFGAGFIFPDFWRDVRHLSYDCRGDQQPLIANEDVAKSLAWYFLSDYRLDYYFHDADTVRELPFTSHSPTIWQVTVQYTAGTKSAIDQMMQAMVTIDECGRLVSIKELGPKK